MTISDEPKARFNLFFEQFTNTVDLGKKKSIAQSILNLLKGGLSDISSIGDTELLGKLEILLKDMWNFLEIWDTESIGTVYNVDRSNYIFQFYYTKALIHSAQSAECLEFLKLGYPVYNSQDILENLYEIASLANNWEYLALMISANEIFDDKIMSSYIKNHSAVIDSQIIKNYNAKHAHKELTKFLKLLWAKFPKDVGITLEYLEALNSNMDIPTMTNILRTTDFSMSMDEFQSIRLSKLFLTIREAQRSVDILNRVLVESPENEEAIEVLIQALYVSGEFERIIAILGDHRKVLSRSPSATEAFMVSCQETGNYRSALEVLDTFSSKYPFTPLTYVALSRLLLMSGNKERAKTFMGFIPDSLSNLKEVRKLKLEFSKLEGVDNEFLNSSILYIMENSEDRKYLSSLVNELWEKGKKAMICRLYSELPNVFVEKKDLKYAVLSLIADKSPEKVVESIHRLEFDQVDDQITIELLSRFRNGLQWKWPESLKPENFQWEKEYMEYLRNFFMFNVGMLEAPEKLPPSCISLLKDSVELLRSLHKMEKEEVDEIYQRIKGKEYGQRDVQFLNYPVVNSLIRMGEVEEAKALMDEIPKCDDPYYEYFSLVTHGTMGGSGKIKKLQNLRDLTGSALIEGTLLDLEGNDMGKDQLISRVEQLVKDGGGLFVPWMKTYEVISKKYPEELPNYQDILEYSAVNTQEALRVKISLLRSQGNIHGALKHMAELYEMPRKTVNDTIAFVNLALEAEDRASLELVSSDLERFSFPIDIYESVGNFYLRLKEPEAAQHYFEKMKNSSSGSKGTNGLLRALIDQGKYDLAYRELESSKAPDSLKILLYSSAGNVNALSSILKGLTTISLDMVDILDDVVDKYWDNKIIKSNLISLAKRTYDPSISLDVSARLNSDGKLEESLEILRSSFKMRSSNYSLVSALVDKLDESSKYEEMINSASLFFKTDAQIDNKKVLFSKVLKYLFNQGMFKEIFKFYETYKNLLNAESVETIALSLITQQMFEEASDLLSKTHLSILDQDRFNNLTKVLKRSENVSDIITISEKLMKACVKYDKFLDKREAAIYTKINLSKIDEVYEFLKEPGEYHHLDEDYLERLSCKVFKAIYKKTQKETIEELGLHDYFLGLGMKDIQLAKDIKAYIEESFYQSGDRKVRHDMQSMKLLSRAAALPSLNPFIYCISLNIGIREAMNLRTAVLNLEGNF